MPQRRFLKATLRAHFAQNQPHSNLPRWQSLWSLDTKRERSVASSRTLSTAFRHIFTAHQAACANPTTDLRQQKSILTLAELEATASLGLTGFLTFNGTTVAR